MVKITMGLDCENSPKRKLLKNFNSAFAEGDIDFLASSVTDEFRWIMVGDKTVTGKSDFIIALEKMKGHIAKELIIDKIVTHGREGALNGVLKMKNGKNYAFSDVYEFISAKGTKIKSMTSYVIEI